MTQHQQMCSTIHLSGLHVDREVESKSAELLGGNLLPAFVPAQDHAQISETESQFCW